MSTATILVGMSVSDVDRRELLLGAAAKVDATVAFLQMSDPSLARELTRLTDVGATTINLLGINTGPLAPGHSWLRRIAAHWWRERAGLKPTITVATELATSVSDSDALRSLLADAKPITGTEPGITSEAWEHVQSHRHQVMICRGPRCTAQGQEDNLRSMIIAMMQHQLGDADVLLVHTGCQFPCNQAPVISVQPDDVWYGKVDPAAAESIVTSHFIGGQPVDSHRLPR